MLIALAQIRVDWTKAFLMEQLSDGIELRDTVRQQD
jgi:hypothetical protein